MYLKKGTLFKKDIEYYSNTGLKNTKSISKQFQPETKTLIRKLERTLSHIDKICLYHLIKYAKMNDCCLTTHTYIYMYMCERTIYLSINLSIYLLGKNTNRSIGV